ncbi:Stp1/IreP family PP2C-type Ser/Thr phosphatase [Tengunoibacter tsumagoiensis]|uniref:Protein phosphatase n=1 Tax=Tengunoibacter tsumagoiensis TaxID=2014871 RepID=A0A401ZTD7_9CHLR|nr:Stp1/IreP family PP2C-type Ser/Thr phosphatase [Tengunoibacter tsumagoiensis]GCE10178.1 protein phosphatase [Tengunoibacter tsumagoiensis]
MPDILPHVEVALRSDVGRTRNHNEDSMTSVVPEDPAVLASKGILLLVADGMGGHAKGEVASKLAVETIPQAYYQDEGEDPAEALKQAIQNANAAIYQQVSNEESINSRAGMGTTCIAVALHGDTAYAANVGDSRAYIIRNGEVLRLSQDHSWVAEQVRAGIITEKQASVHPQRNVITRALGIYPNVEIDLLTEKIQPNDVFLLCSDGLSNLVSSDELRAILEEHEPQESAQRLIDCANAHGGLDNITAVVARVSSLD